MDSSFMSRDLIERHTLVDFGSDRLHRLCEAAGMEGDATSILATFRGLSHPWGSWPIGPRPRWYPSILSDDHAPFEFSTAYSGDEVELQLYLEPQGGPPSLASNKAAGLAVLRHLSSEFGVSLDRFHDVEDLFLPERSRGLFTLLFGVTWARGQAPRFKVYVNPQVHGPESTSGVMREAMKRLGFGRAWDAACAARGSRDPSVDQVMYLCLDLSADRVARVKVYRRHPDVTAEGIEDLAGVAADYRAGEARRFYDLLAHSAGPFRSKPLITSLTFRQGDQERPGSATLEFPISSYVSSDAVARARVRECLIGYGLDPAAYERAIRAVAARPLAQGNGIHAHVTLRRVAGAPRITTYFATEAYVVEPEHWVSAPRSSRSALTARFDSVPPPA